MITISNADYAYRTKRFVFNQLSVSFAKGHIYGLLGKNGAGKSTLLRIIAGLIEPSAGKATIEGATAFEREPATLQKLLYIPEEIYLPAISFRQFEKIYGAFYPNFSSADFYRYLAEFEISVSGKLHECSYGQQKKIYISFALACNVDYLLLDEPTNGMDIPSKKQFRKVLSGYLTDERLVIISSHQVRDLDNLMDILVIVDNSKILLQQPTSLLQDTLYFAKTKELPKVNLLYSEAVIGGYEVVLHNDGTMGHSPLDTEKLFNAVLATPTVFTDLFNN